MRNKMISISEQMFAKLKEQENASGLIECLLQDHFKMIPEVKKEDLHEKLKEIELEAANKKEIITKEIQSIEQTEVEKEADIFLNEQKHDSKIMDFIARVLIDTGIKISNEESEAYFDLFDKGKISYFAFIEKLKNDNNTQQD